MWPCGECSSRLIVLELRCIKAYRVTLSNIKFICYTDNVFEQLVDLFNAMVEERGIIVNLPR